MGINTGNKQIRTFDVNLVLKPGVVIMKKENIACWLIYAEFFLGLCFELEDGGGMFL
jgi:hypothetical protein